MRRWAWRLACVLVVVVGVLCVVAGSSFAVGGGVQWTVTSVSGPTNFVAGDESGDDEYQVVVKNTGEEASSGTVSITDALPVGLVLDRAGVKGHVLSDHQLREPEPLSCGGVTCVDEKSVLPDESLVITVSVDIEMMASPAVDNVVRVSGGGAADASMMTPTTIGSQPARFGIAPGSVTAALSNVQAGAHADLTTSVGFNTVDDEGTLAGVPKETVVELPAGFAGDLVDTPTCSAALFLSEICPIGTQVGIVTVTLHTLPEVFTEPIYNLAPEPGDVEKLGFTVAAFNIQGGVSVVPVKIGPGEYEYRAQVTFQDVKDIVKAELDDVSATIWGVPTATVHDPWRLNPKTGGTTSEYGVSSDNALVPFLSNPTTCSATPLVTNITSISWEEEESTHELAEAHAQALSGPLGGCDRLGLPSTFNAQPTTTQAYSPTGLDVENGVRQSYESPEGLSTSEVQRAIVKLPEGMTVNPSAGAGLGSCTLSEYEAEEVQTPRAAGCPNDSKLGTVKVQSPGIKEEGVGSVFVAQPYENLPAFGELKHPGGSLLALYVVIRFPVRGVVVKLAGKVSLDPETGRLTTSFEGLPQLPYSLFVFSFHQGATSPLVTPPLCGSYTVTDEMTPWSNTTLTLTDLSLPFEIGLGADANPCPTGGVPPFAPQVIAGTLDNDAGSYSPLDVRIVRNDGEQEITGFSTLLAPGLLANLTGVPFCPEADIQRAREKTGTQEEAEPSCPVSSQIGRLLAGAGVGQILAYTQGKVYMGGPFQGAPFSIVAITAAKVGPFDLGTVVVHLPLQINPLTAQASITGAPGEIPHIIDGIVIHVRDIRVYIERPQFTLNPTSCKPLQFTAGVIGSGANYAIPADADTVTVTDPFEAADCASLQFKPTFKVSTSGKTSKENGASLTTTLTYPPASLGNETNIASVKVELPKRLPSRLSTLQKACTAAVFETNPADCPPGSIVGSATTTTPILPVPLTGPAYFVSHGGAKFPELVIVLQGDGVTFDLHGETFISKQGITTSTFATVPDVPVGTFQLTLPEGPHSALAANGNLCKTKLTIPTSFTAQNGTTHNQNTKITTTNCPKTHTTTHKHHTHNNHNKGHTQHTKR
jgi:uncharacterized repeat protein (TIGR01451 family)